MFKNNDASILEPDLTGDHAENKSINAVSKTTKSLMECLPKSCQDMLTLNIRRYDGRGSKEAEDWLRDIEEWLKTNGQRLTSTFDVLLTSEAKTLWENVKASETTDEKARMWFLNTFTIHKSMTDKIKELAALEQEEDERFATFEIRVRKALAEILHSGREEEEIVQDLISNKAKDIRLREALLTKPETKIEEARALAKIYESNRNKEEHVKIVEQRTYARIAGQRPNNNKPSEYYSRRNQASGPTNQYIPRNEEFSTTQRANYQERRGKFQGGNYERSGRSDVIPGRSLPTVSMKNIAKRLYNESRGLPPPPIQKLAVGDCFCCGEKGHRRQECPLGKRCLICGKEGHMFRDCFSLRNEKHRQYQKIACIQDEESQSMREDDGYNQKANRDDSYDFDDRYNIPEKYTELNEGTKNANDSMGYISSVESRK